MSRPGQAASAGYKTKPLVVPLISGYLPEDARGQWRGLRTPDRGAREERVPVPTREVVCYECGKKSHIPEAALSAHCVHCCTHLNTANIELKPGTHRLTVRTLGDVTVPAHVELSHLSIICRNLHIAGKAAGAMRCSGTLTLRGEAQVEGQVRAHSLLVPAGARAVASPGVSAGSAEVEGQLTGRISAEGTIHIGRSGIVVGDCRGARLMVEIGGAHRGAWSHVQEP